MGEMEVAGEDHGAVHQHEHHMVPRREMRGAALKPEPTVKPGFDEAKRDCKPRSTASHGGDRLTFS